jgi:hypothetical protein
MAEEDKYAPSGEPVAFWVEGASEEIRDAHFKALRWSHVLTWQIDRLQASRLAAMDSHERVLADGFYPDEGRWPFFEMEAEGHFALIAARQLGSGASRLRRQ